MKNIIALAILIATANTTIAQSFFNKNMTEYFTVSVVNDPAASFKENGIDIGAEIEYVGLIYAAARVENFEALPGGYTSLTGAIGLNLYNKWQTLRLYAGGRGGVVIRNGATNPIAGIESGIDYYFDNGFFIGARAAYDRRGDMKAFQNPVIWRENGYLRLGYRWFWKK